MKPAKAGGEPEPLPGQLMLPGMPYPSPEPGGAQPVLPGLDDLRDLGPSEDPGLAAVAAELTALDSDGSRMAAAIRGALDMLLDGQHTGRYRWEQLHKTENLVHNREPAGRTRAFGDGGYTSGGDLGLMTTSSHSHPRGAGTGAATKDEAAVLAASAHLTDRDRDLVRLVAVHRVLTTGQLTALGFGNLTTARHRLSALVRLGLLRRFRPHPPIGSAPWHYVLGPTGAAVLGVEDRDEKRWAPHVRADRQLALERSGRLAHMTGRNWFFAALAQHARQHGGELREWLNEADAAARYEHTAISRDDRARLPRPDAAGTWDCQAPRPERRSLAIGRDGCDRPGRSTAAGQPNSRLRIGTSAVRRTRLMG